MPVISNKTRQQHFAAHLNVQTTDHKPEPTNHNPQNTKHKSQTTNHKPKITNHNEREAGTLELTGQIRVESERMVVNFRGDGGVVKVFVCM